MDTNPIRYSDLVAPDSSITDLISQLEQLIAVYDGAKGKIQSSAAALEKSMEGVSGATAEQREQIRLVTEESDKLVAKYRDINSAQWKAKQAFAEMNAAKKETVQIDKLITQINTSLEGSYNKLSAQYRLNKIALNEMSAEMRYGTEAGRKLEQETNALYARMNEMQKATGKYTLQVGNYERALGGLVGVNSNLVSALTDSRKATDTFRGVLRTIKSPVGIAIGAVGALAGTFKLFKESIHSTQQSGDRFDNAMAGWRETWAQFKRGVATMDFSGFIQGAVDAYAAGKKLSEVLDEVFERSNSISLQRAMLGEENEVLLETLRDQTKGYDERINAGQKYLDNMKGIYEQETEMLKDVAEAELDRLWAAVKNRKEAKGLTKEEFAEKIQTYNLDIKLVREAQAYNKALEDLSETQRTNQFQAGLAIDMYQSLNYQEKALEAENAQKTLTETTSEQVKEFAQFLKTYDITSNDIVKSYVQAQAAYISSMSALPRETRRITTQLNSLRAQRIKDEKKSEEDRKKDRERSLKEEEKQRREAEQKNLTILKLGLDNLKMQLEAERTDTEHYLELRLKAVEQERQIELATNRAKAEEMRIDERLINERYDALALRTAADFHTKLAQQTLADEQELAKIRFDQLDSNEREVTLFRLTQERQRLVRLLEIDKKAAVKMTDAQREAMEETIKAIEKEAARLPYNNLYELLGLNVNAQQQDALRTAIDSVKDSVKSLMNSWAEAAAAATKAADEQVSAAEKTLQAEIEARNAGYANNVAMAQKELALAQKNREKALREEQKAQKAQMVIDSLDQASSLITATANIWKAFTKMGVTGPILAGVATATMWGSFIAAKVKAAQVTKYEHGGVELLEGGSHASGHDIDLGMTKGGKRRKAEGGEYLAIINRKSSRKYGQAIPAIVNALNDGTYEYLRAGNEMQMQMTDVSTIEKEVTRIRKQGDERRMVEGGYVVTRYKNLTRRVRS